MLLTISHHKSDTIADFTGTITQFNSTGGTATVAASNLVLPSDWNSVHDYTAALGPINYFEPYPTVDAATTFTPGNGTWYLDHFCVPFDLNSGKIHNAFNFGTGVSGPLDIGSATISSGSTGIRQRNGTFYCRHGIYAYGTGADSTRLNSIWSREESILFSDQLSCTTSGAGATAIGLSVTMWASFPKVIDSLGGVTYSTTGSNYGTTTGASSMAVSKVSTHTDLVNYQNLFTGPVFFPSGFATSLSAGQYVMALNISTSTSQASTGAVFNRGTIFGGLPPAALAMTIADARPYKSLGTSISASTSNWMKGDGFIAAAGAAMPNPVALSDVVVNATNNQIYWNYAKY